MRWCSFTSQTGGPARLGAASPDGSGRVLDVTGWARSREAQTPPDLLDLLESSPATQERVTDLVRSAPADGVGWVRPEEVHLLAPLRSPGSLRHVVARDGALPVLAHAPRRGMHGPDEPLSVPAYTDKLDVALHVAAVLGRSGCDLEPTGALEAVFGFTLLLQWSARDAARDVTSHLGPWVVTPDEWEPRSGHDATLTVDGAVLAAGTSASPPWTPGQVLSWASRGEQMCASDVVGLGVLGAARDTEAWLRPGQVVSAEVVGLGTLTAAVC